MFWRPPGSTGTEPLFPATTLCRSARLAINGGAGCAATLVAAFGVSLPLIGQGSVAFAGGLVGAGVVLALSGGASGPARLVLAGSALALALGSMTGMLLLRFEEETQSLFAWGNGNLVQISLEIGSASGRARVGQY